MVSLAQMVVKTVEASLLGKPQAVRLAVSCLLGEGHLLIDDIPGVGKTTLALSLARAVGGSFQRIQFTSDLLPADVIGVSVYNSRENRFEFKPGPLFHNVVLVDEINRASPKTQSSLLEAMQERQVSVDNHTYPLPQPFFVVATQNPHECYGTYPLPESQLDRFMMRIHLGYPDPQTEEEIISGDRRMDFQFVGNSHSLEELVHEMEFVRKVKVDESLNRYLVDIARATRQSPYIDLGLSPRGTLALRRASQAYAYIDGRDYVAPDDIKAVAPSVMLHRLRFKGGSHETPLSQSNETLLEEILSRIPIPA